MEIVELAFGRGPGIPELISYVKQVLSHLRRVQLSIETILKIVTPTGLLEAIKPCFHCMAAILKECAWQTRVKGIALLSYFRYHLKIKIEEVGVAYGV